MNPSQILKGSTKLVLYAANAKPNPKLGQSLGPLGLNMMQFCKEFNDRTLSLRNDVPMRILLKAYQDRSFKFKIKPPPTSWFLKRIAMQELGSSIPGRAFIAGIGIKYIYEIAKIKKSLDPDLREIDLYSICKMIIAQARNMGIDVVADSLAPTPIAPKRIL